MSDAKAQVSYDCDTGRVTTFLVSPQHKEDISVMDIRLLVEAIMETAGKIRTIICPIRISPNSSLSMYKTKLVTGKPHQFTRFFYALYLTIGSALEVSVRMVCPSCKKRRPSLKAPASKNICDYISNA